MKRLLKPRGLFWVLLPIGLWWVWRDIPLDQVLQHLLSLKAWQVFILVGFNLALTTLFSLRWWMILVVMGYPLPYFKLVAYRLAGFALSFLTPGPQFGGEPLQVYALTSQEKVPNPAALASVMLDKTLELLVNFSFLVFAALLVIMSGLLPGSAFARVWLPVGFLLFLPFGYLVSLVFNRRPLTAILMLFSRIRFLQNRMQPWVETTRLAEGKSADFCRCRPGMFGLVLGISLAVWALVMLEFWLCYSFLGLELSVQELAFTLVAARLAMLLPMPGGLGTVEASQVLAVRFLGHHPAYAVGAMLLARLRDISLAVLGLLLVFNLTNREPFEILPRAAGEKITIHQEV